MPGDNVGYEWYPLDVCNTMPYAVPLPSTGFLQGRLGMLGLQKKKGL